MTEFDPHLASSAAGYESFHVFWAAHEIPAPAHFNASIETGAHILGEALRNRADGMDTYVGYEDEPDSDDYTFERVAIPLNPAPERMGIPLAYTYPVPTSEEQRTMILMTALRANVRPDEFTVWAIHITQRLAESVFQGERVIIGTNENGFRYMEATRGEDA